MDQCWEIQPACVCQMVWVFYYVYQPHETKQQPCAGSPKKGHNTLQPTNILCPTKWITHWLKNGGSSWPIQLWIQSFMNNGSMATPSVSYPRNKDGFFLEHSLIVRFELICWLGEMRRKQLGVSNFSYLSLVSKIQTIIKTKVLSSKQTQNKTYCNLVASSDLVMKYMSSAVMWSSWCGAMSFNSARKLGPFHAYFVLS